ncbi:MAG TPA: autorepressor SdpR family transcription factor [Thermoanaerobaculia bacterium]|jgi:ArsR family transcriptional regulator
MDAFRALADPTRREILRLLRDGPKTSGEIAEQFPTAWATISRHLGALRDAGLILSERNGQQIVYELNTTVFQDLVEHLLDWVRPTKRDGGRRPRSGGGKHA